MKYAKKIKKDPSISLVYEDDTEKSAQRSLREKQELISRVEGSLDFYKKAAIQRPDNLLAKDYQKYLEYTQEQGLSLIHISEPTRP